MWLATVTKRDVSNAVRALASQSHDSCERHWEAVVKVLKYLNRTEYVLTFERDHDRLSVYCDADYAKNETDGCSVSGVAVMYGVVLVSATSRAQHRVTLSTTEAEYVALAEGAVLTFFRHQTVSGCGEEHGIVLYKNNEGAKALAETPLSSGRSTRIAVRYYFIRELVGTGKVRVVYVDPGWQNANILTKPL
ncbi:unnamed protein product, partial [Sphacelaria rigidula]